jgi:transposase
MKAMSKSELAMKAGVSVQTLMRWLRPFRQELEALGLRPNMKVLSPRIVGFISEKLAIDV